MTTGLMTKLGWMDATKRRSDAAMLKEYRAIARVESEVDKMLSRCLRMRKIANYSSREVRRTRTGGRNVVRRVVSFTCKPENRRTRHVAIEFFKKVPFAYAFTDCGPGRHCNRWKSYHLDGDGILKFYKSEILA